MVTAEEEKFIAYWENHRSRKKKLLKQLYIGLPLAVAMVIAIFANFVSGWYKRADMELRSNASLIIVVVIAAIGIVLFTTIFSARHRWDQNEQRYLELLAKKQRP